MARRRTAAIFPSKNSQPVGSSAHVKVTCAQHALSKGTFMSIKVIKSDVPQPLANYSEASQAGDLIFAAGQLASDFKTGVPAEARKHPNFPFYGSDIKLQTRFVLENLKKTFEAAGSSLENVF